MLIYIFCFVKKADTNKKRLLATISSFVNIYYEAFRDISLVVSRTYFSFYQETS